MLRVAPLPSLEWAEGVDFLTLAREESTAETSGTRLGRKLGGVVDLERNLVQLRHRISANLSGRAVVVGNTLGAFLQSAADNSRLVVDLADDQNGTDHAGGQTLQDDSLVVVHRDL